MSQSISYTYSDSNGVAAAPRRKVAIVGAGLVGSLAALNFAQMGNEVDLYEYREDIRKAELVQGRSINLALSQRGRKALAAVGLEEKVLATAIPMRGRMLHNVRGRTSIVLYDPCTKQCLYSVGRKQLNELLLNACDAFPNISCHFEHKLATANIAEGQMQFRRPNEPQLISASADLIVGCDGAFSTLRQQLVRTPGFNYSQEYISTGYLELCIPAKDGEFQMPPNYLHIWPRDSFMMIALPNQDKSFTVTLSMPFELFAELKTHQQLLDFFRQHYVDALPLIGEQQLIKDFFKTRPQHLLSVKCKPYHFADKALILGDAAHAMVPYYGQGMNAGMEDLTLLSSILSQQLPLDVALAQFTESRWRDAYAICDLAMYNYVEMRDLTKRWSFRCRKWLDTTLFRLFPRRWVPLYNSVSFSSMPYSQCIANRQWQDKLLGRLMTFTLLASLIAGGAIYARRLR
ncbi:kynurenine 3-monooxygenase [Drosophila grimshawi]|uniref:Kynurenine 3-monooxygenase n=1 Tax=Drosophila grimshawi TaxID=7222 RepID=B4J4Y6_DROGR|nr:kynurenine 3-monooxygenase [Drosophila grimshawi]EDW01692.1 GH21583 [Drosophila grimshawi]